MAKEITFYNIGWILIFPEIYGIQYKAPEIFRTRSAHLVKIALWIFYADGNILSILSFTEGLWKRPINAMFCFRVADNQHERGVEAPRETHPSLFWSKYWDSRLPAEENHQSSVRTKSFRNNRLDPRHVRVHSEEVERFDGSNALKLQSGCDGGSSPPVLVLVAGLVSLVRLWWWWNSPCDLSKSSWTKQNLNRWDKKIHFHHDKISRPEEVKRTLFLVIQFSTLHIMSFIQSCHSLFLI